MFGECNLKTLIIFMGPAGVGKTELVKYVKQKHPQALVINKKEIELNFPKETTDQQKQRYYDSINSMLKIGDFIIVDSNHILKKDRLELFDSLEINYDELKIIGV